MPIIVGAPRSGTTLLRLMLDAHTDLAIPPETGFLATDQTFLHRLSRQEFADFIEQFPPGVPGWQDFCIPFPVWREALEAIEPFSPVNAFRTFYRLYAARFSKMRWGDKTPSYVFCMRQIKEMLPKSRFIHLIRDGRDVALSWRKTWFAPGQDMKTLASHWKQSVSAGLDSRKDGSHYLEIRYEELIQDTVSVLQRICDYISLDWQPAMLNYFANSPARLAEHAERRRDDGTVLVSREQRLEQQRLTTRPPISERVLAWRVTLTPSEREEFASVAGDLLDTLGYEP
ncbi:putative Sulfotransferase domain superfamily [Candidatus Methylomirabilis oxygeniifera]|uniref:Putative Sulfotransferase domain superfamily n=1 Tax=Methylomirabilis oxygeniifera TaxID=671143 RepID=D5MM92_METO1|nr:putative Sulfotransferase domain superfamily [Candidatus Methylomirabilis oxyfera]